MQISFVAIIFNNILAIIEPDYLLNRKATVVESFEDGSRKAGCGKAGSTISFSKSP